MLPTNPRIGFVGFGEVAFHLSKGLKQAGVEQIAAYDNSLIVFNKNQRLHHRATIAGVELLPTLGELVMQSDLVISAAHGNAALDIACETAQFIRPNEMFADLNNVTPSIKKSESEIINARGASFVDIGLLELPALLEHKALMYVSGNGAEQFKKVMSPFGMNIEIALGEAGQAAMIKALMNIYLKGLQALCIEVGLSAYKASIPINLISLLVSKMTMTVPDEFEMAFWIQRGGLHARRKMVEVQHLMEMMKDWGIDPLMMDATFKRLNATAQYCLEDRPGVEMHSDDGQMMIAIMDRIGAEQNIQLR